MTTNHSLRLFVGAALCGSALLLAARFAPQYAPASNAPAHLMQPGTAVYDTELREFARLDSARDGDPPNAAILLVESWAGAQVRMAVPQDALRIRPGNRLVLESFSQSPTPPAAARPSVLQL